MNSQNPSYLSDRTGVPTYKKDSHPKKREPEWGIGWDAFGISKKGLNQRGDNNVQIFGNLGSSHWHAK